MKLYVDFDGVILDTWPAFYQVLKEQNVEMYEKVKNKTATADDDVKIIEIFNTFLDWDVLVNSSNPINNSIDILNKLNNTNMFEMAILTHCNSDKEIECKTRFVNEKLPGICIIPVLKHVSKASVVNPSRAILIDDYVGNLNDWKNAGGIAVKFSTKDIVDSDFYHISSLDQITAIISELESTEGSNGEGLVTVSVTA